MQKKDLVTQVNDLCNNSDFKVVNTIDAVMANNSDTGLVDLITKIAPTNFRPFYAYSKDYIYFLEMVCIADNFPGADSLGVVTLFDEAEYYIVSIPRHPNRSKDAGYFGGYR